MFTEVFDFSFCFMNLSTIQILLKFLRFTQNCVSKMVEIVFFFTCLIIRERLTRNRLRGGFFIQCVSSMVLYQSVSIIF